MNKTSELDISSLGKALDQLKESMLCYYSEVVQSNDRLVPQLRAAAIQAFEFTYELSWKMLKRYLEMILASPDEMKELSFPDLIRTGCEYGLLRSDLEVWKNFRKERSMTSHTYDEDKAAEVFESIPLFVEEVEYLFAKLQAGIKSA